MCKGTCLSHNNRLVTLPDEIITSVEAILQSCWNLLKNSVLLPQIGPMIKVHFVLYKKCLVRQKTLKIAKNNEKQWKIKVKMPIWG